MIILCIKLGLIVSNVVVVEVVVVEVVVVEVVRVMDVLGGGGGGESNGCFRWWCR